MSKYEVRTTTYFLKATKKLNKSTQKAVLKFIKNKLIDVEYPSSPGKKLVGNFSGYTRFRIGSFRLIAGVNDDGLILANIYIAKRAEVYKINSN